jgi:hypothetical protein
MIEYEPHIRHQLGRERAERLAAEYRRSQRHGSSSRHRARRRIRLAAVLGSLRRWSHDRVPAQAGR